MKNGRLKNSITYLFLVLFLSVKMAGLHALTHFDDKDHALHCLVCDQIVSHNLTPAIAPEAQDFTIADKESVVQKEITEHYDFIPSTTVSSDQLFSRPPPFLL